MWKHLYLSLLIWHNARTIRSLNADEPSGKSFTQIVMLVALVALVALALVAETIASSPH